METELAWCPACSARVRIAWTPAPTHEGQANLPDAPEMVCLELADDGCAPGTVCPLSSLPRGVMALRLAKSGMREHVPPTARMKCDGCGQVAEMEVVDRTTLLCPVCGTVNRWILLELADRGWVAIGRMEAADGA